MLSCKQRRRGKQRHIKNKLKHLDFLEMKIKRADEQLKCLTMLRSLTAQK